MDSDGGDKESSDKEQEDFIQMRQQKIRRLVGTHYLLTKAEQTLELDSNEEFGELSQGQSVFAKLEEDV